MEVYSAPKRFTYDQIWVKGRQHYLFPFHPVLRVVAITVTSIQGPKFRNFPPMPLWIRTWHASSDATGDIGTFVQSLILFISESWELWVNVDRVFWFILRLQGGAEGIAFVLVIRAITTLILVGLCVGSTMAHWQFTGFFSLRLHCWVTRQWFQWQQTHHALVKLFRKQMAASISVSILSVFLFFFLCPLSCPPWPNWPLQVTQIQRVCHDTPNKVPLSGPR